MNQKYMAIFLAVIMVTSIFAYFIASLIDNPNVNEENSDLQSQLENAPKFDTIPGTKMEHELNSIQDGLEITPEGVAVVSYVDYSRVYGTPLEVMAPNITELFSVYNSMIVQRYSAYSATGDFAFEAHDINPEVINFEYMLTDNPYNGYYMLSRGGELYNVVGTPMLFGSRDSLETVIDVSSGTNESSTDFDRILEYVEPGAEYSTLVVGTDDVVEQYYLEYRNMNDGNYSRTEVFLEPDQSILDNITAKEANSRERGLYYNATTYDDNVTKVVITANASNIYGLIMEQFR